MIPGVRTPEILNYSFWALFTYKLLPYIRDPSSDKVLYSPCIMLYRGHLSMPYRIWPLAPFKSPSLCCPQKPLLSHSGLFSEDSKCLPGHLLRAQLTFCLILLHLSTYPDSTQPWRSRQMLLLSGSPPDFSNPGARDASLWAVSLAICWLPSYRSGVPKPRVADRYWSSAC